MAARLRLLLLTFALTCPSAVVCNAAVAAAQPRRHAAPQQSLGERAAAFARRLVGVPYRYGGTSPASGFDCSGLVRSVYGRLGIALPHSSYADFELGRAVDEQALRPGDLVFFDGVGHVGLYLGDGRFVHAPHTGASVEVTALAGYGRYDGARRLVAGTGRTLLHG
jgi:cell wall-associated NlpC family hydrolase